LHHALGSSHHLATSLAVQHLLELRVVLAASKGVALAEVYATAVREVPLGSGVVRVRQRTGRRLAIIILAHARSGVDLLEGNQIRLGKLHLTLLVVRLVGVTTILVAALTRRDHIHLPVGRLHVVRVHAELANVRRVRVEIQSCIANRICNDSTVFALRWNASLKDGAAVIHLLLAHLHVLAGLLHPVVSRGPKVYQALLVLLNEGLVVRHGHF